MNLGHLKIGKRLGLAFGLILLLVIIQLVIEVNSRGKIQAGMNEIQNGSYARLEYANVILKSVTVISREMLAVVVAEDQTALLESKKRIETFRPEYREALNNLIKTESTTEGKLLLHALEQDLKNTAAIDNNIIELCLANRTAEAIPIVENQMLPGITNVENEIFDLIKNEEKNCALLFNELEQVNTSARMEIFILGCIVLVFGLVNSFFITRSITNPLQTVVDAAEKAAARDLTVDVPYADNRDEIGILAGAFHRMVENLRAEIAQIIEATNVLAASAGQISTSIAQIASSSTETAAAVNQTTTTIEEVKQTAQVSSQKANYISEIAQNAVAVSQTGEKSVSETIAGMNKIQEQMEFIAESIVRLSEQIQAVGEIIATVDDIAEQSHLLAVNASIEAAKAGEQGKGFTVVAQEIRSLASQSKQATTHVRSILNDIQKATSAAVMTTEQGSKAVAAGVKQSSETSRSIRTLATTIEEAMQAVIQIAASTQEQYIGMEQSAYAMENIRQASAQNVEGVKQLETGAIDLDELGQHLKQLVERYKV